MFPMENFPGTPITGKDLGRAALGQGSTLGSRVVCATVPGSAAPAPGEASAAGVFSAFSVSQAQHASLFPPSAAFRALD